MQMTLGELDETSAPPRLVVLYEADRSGLLQAAIGRLSSVHSWAEEWRFSLFERQEITPDIVEPAPRHPAYEEQPEPILAPIEAIRPRSEDAGHEMNSEK
jgi:hypothetical protein